jgi:uncharacterized protein DUF5666
MRRSLSLRFPLQAIVGVLVTGAILAALVPALGCGGSSSNPPPPPPPPGNTKTQLRIGDAPVDSVIAFELTIASPIVVTPSGGGSPLNIIVAANNRLELSHMAGKLEPLSVLNVPQGSFTSAAITINNPEMTFLDSLGNPHSLQGSTSQVTVTFNPALTIGTSPAVLNVDLNVANSLAITNGVITGFDFKASSFNITTAVVAGEAEQEDDTGELEDVTGLVASSTSNTFTLNVGQGGAQLTFAFDNTTTVSDGAVLPPVTGTIVKVEGVTKLDGTLFANEVEGIEDQTNGAELEGLITAVTGNPATSLDVLAQDGIGAGIDDTKVGTTFTADVSGVQTSKYRVDLGKVDTSNLGQVGGPPAQSQNFPFDATTIHGGQRVEVESAGTVASGTITADQVKLEQQAVTGTVTSISGPTPPRTITITLPADSAFAILSGGGTPTVTVFDQPKTDHKLATINVGDTIRVRGLLFNATGIFNMIARRITP